MRVPFVNGEGEVSVGSTATGAGGCADAAGPGTRPLRADAQRNRDRILEAAEAVFAAEGVDVPVDVIAEKAGVGVGTLYRHFPTKERLCAAILLQRLVGITADARALAEAEDPAAAFFGFLQHVVREGAAKRDLVIAVTGADAEFEVAAAPVKDDLLEAVGVLLRRAQEAGAVRPDVTAPLVVSLVGATCQAATHMGAPPSCDMWAVVCDGLRPQSQS